MIADIAKEHGLFLISDEVYREFVYGGEPLASMAQFDDAAENVVVVDSISKRKKRTLNHMGIYLKNGYFAHASTSKGVMVNHLSENYYKKGWRKSGRVW